MRSRPAALRARRSLLVIPLLAACELRGADPSPTRTLGAAEAGELPLESDSVLAAALRAQAGEEPWAMSGADVDGDGRRDAVVLLGAPRGCGAAGCTLLVLARVGDEWRPLSRTHGVRPPVELLPQRTLGWRDLAVTTQEGATLRRAVLRAGRDGYPPDAASAPAAPTVRADQVLFAP